MRNPFGKKKTPAVNQLLRENKRMLDRSIREIERERRAWQAQEKKLITEIKKTAKEGQMGAVEVMTKVLIRTRHQITKSYEHKSQLQGMSLGTQTLISTQAMGDTMKGVTKAMSQMKQQMNLPALQRIMMESERQNERMEEKTKELVSQVLDEIGIDINSELVKAPTAVVSAPATASKVAQPEGAAAGGDSGIDIDLLARLDNLRKM